jgi:hypothetical protein
MVIGIKITSSPANTKKFNEKPPSLYNHAHNNSDIRKDEVIDAFINPIALSI